MGEYYRLLGIECSPELRDKLDCGLKVCHRPSNEAYGQISANYLGVCALNRPDGLCAMHAELGEDLLPSICRLYPRNPLMLTTTNQCSCSNSCEAVVELLYSLRSPIKFISQNLNIQSNHQHNITMKAIAFLQDRAKSLTNRLRDLGHFLLGDFSPSLVAAQLTHGIQTLHHITVHYNDSISISSYSDDILTNYDLMDVSAISTDKEKHILDTLQNGFHQILQLIPHWDEFMEQLLINHMFYHTFPYYKENSTLKESFYTVCLIFGFIEFQVFSYIKKDANVHPIVDHISALFRLIEHSNFHEVIVKLLRIQTIPSHEIIEEILQLDEFLHGMEDELNHAS